MALCLSAQALAQPDAPNGDIFGTWEITAVLDSGDPSGMSDREAARLVGKSVSVEREGIKLNGLKMCKSPSYNRTVEETAKHLREKGHVSTENLHLPDPVTVIDAKCTFLYLKGKGTMVLSWDGVYFDAVKQRE